MTTRQKILVCGAGGFIGSHLVKKLKSEGYWVRGVDIKKPEFSESTANEFILSDLRLENNCIDSLKLPDGSVVDEVYQLAADMGGMGFIHSAECEIMVNSSLINTYMVKNSAELGVKRYFFSSSACIYKNMETGEKELAEEDAYPAMPDNEYGWEKLYAERMAMAFERKYGMRVRLARFQNCYGPEGTWYGGREKAPAALSRKVAQASDGGAIEVWGDGTAVRAFTYIDDMVDGIIQLMGSDLKGGINIGRKEYATVEELVKIIAHVAGKKVNIKYINGPVGVQARYFKNNKIESIGWESRFSLLNGIRKTYPWIRHQVKEHPQFTMQR